MVAVIKLPKLLNHARKGLVNIQNIDDKECLKWCLIRYLNLVDHHRARIRKIDKDLARKLDFKDINFYVKIRNILKDMSHYY